MVATTENKPLYAIAGAADAAVGVLRGLPSRLVEAASDTSLRDQVRTKVSELPEDAKQWRTDAGEFVENLPTRAHEFPGRLSELFANVSHDAGRTYQDLADRGEDVVAKLRHDYGPKVDEAVGAVRSRVAKASEDLGEAVTTFRKKTSDVVGDLTGAADEEAPAAGASTTEPAPTVTASPTAAKPAARDIPVKKAPVKKAPTKKAPIKKAATKTAPTKKAATTKAPVKKSTAINGAESPSTEADDA